MIVPDSRSKSLGVQTLQIELAHLKSSMHTRKRTMSVCREKIFISEKGLSAQLSIAVTRTTLKPEITHPPIHVLMQLNGNQISVAELTFLSFSNLMRINGIVPASIGLDELFYI